MIIKKIKCDQFAGIKNKDIVFSPNLNVVYGENESGKSTLIELMHSLLFQSSAVGDKTAADKAFKKRFLPSEVVSGSRGDSSDGTISFSHDGSDYTLEKIWGGESKCLLNENGSIIRSKATIEETLKKVLHHGRGLYDEMVFSTQHNEDSALIAILDNEGTRMKTDLTVLVSQAMSASGGITADRLGEEIDRKLSELGDRWDFDNDRPERRGLKKGTGEVYKANEAYEEACEKYDCIIRSKNAFDRAKAESDTAADILTSALKEQERFDAVYDILKSEADTAKLKQAREAELSPRSEAAEKWEGSIERLRKAVCLKEELDEFEKIECCKKVLSLSEQIKALENEIQELGEITAEDISNVQGRLEENEILTRKLKIRLAARIKKLGSMDIEIVSAVTGMPIAYDESIDINEAVIVKIPGVMEMQLAPKDIDIDETNARIRENLDSVQEIYKKFSVTGYNELDGKYRKLCDKKGELEDLNSEYASYTLDRDIDSLKADTRSLNTEVRTRNEITGDIIALCGTEPLDSVIGKLSAVVEGYTSRFVSIKDNNEAIERLKAEISEYDKKLEAFKEKCGEVLPVTDPDRRKAELKAAVGLAREAADKAKEEFHTARTEYELLACDANDAKADRDEKKQILDDKLALYENWRHIKEVFDRLNAEITENPMQGISDSFKKYLGIISNNRISIKEDMGTSANAVITSGKNIVGYEHLSEGTKDTISIAFRLAVLEYLYPDGGGLAVFDDPFTDMDEERRVQSVALIEEFAKNNQVIFTTCDKRYLAIPGANIINM